MSRRRTLSHEGGIEGTGHPSPAYVKSGAAGGASPLPMLRKGKWTPEEEMYANKIIALFNQGLLTILAGTTLRSYLSDRLNCDPMRITKKFAGASCIGKQVYQASEDFDENEARVALGELAKLENAFLARLEGRGGSRSRASSSAAAAAAASAAAAAGSGGGMYGRDEYDYDNDDGYGDEEQYDDELDGAAGGGRGIVWSTSGRRSGARGAGLPAGAVRMGSRGIGRRVLSEPNLMLLPNSSSPSGGNCSSGGGGGGSSRRSQFKRAHSAMDLEDLRAFHIPTDESGDSAAAQLLVKFMSKMGAEPSLSRPTSMVDLAGVAAAASASSSSSLSAEGQQRQKRQLSGEGVDINEAKGGTGKGIEGRRSSSAGTADTEDSTRSHSSGLQSIPEGGGTSAGTGTEVTQTPTTARPWVS